MNTVNNFDDILDILDRNPDYQEALRQRVLDEEYRRLPERIDRAVKSVDELAQTVAEFVRRTNETLANHEARLERVEGQIADLNAAVNRVLETVADIQNRLANVEAKVDALADVPERLTTLETKVDALADVPERLAKVEAKVDALADVPERLGNVETKVDRMQGQLNNLTGTEYERRIARRARRIANRHLGIRQVQYLLAISVPDNPTVEALLNHATESGIISHVQADDLDDADLILFGKTADDRDCYAVAEVSITIDDSDVDRAHRRAAALNAATGAPAQAAVIGMQISDANRERADSLNVAIVLVSNQAEE